MKQFLRMMLAIVLAVSFMIMPGSAETSETISVTMVRSEVENRILSAMGTGETSAENRWTELLKNEYGIDVEYLWTCFSGEYGEKLGMALASGDLPDHYSFHQYHSASSGL